MEPAGRRRRRSPRHGPAARPDVELPDAKQYPSYGENGYYRSLDGRSISPERREAIERKAATSGTRPSAITYVIGHPKRSRPPCWPTRAPGRRRGSRWRSSRPAPPLTRPPAPQPPPSSGTGRASTTRACAVSGSRWPPKPARPVTGPRPRRLVTSSTPWPRSAWPPRGRWRCCTSSRWRRVQLPRCHVGRPRGDDLGQGHAPAKEPPS